MGGNIWFRNRNLGRVVKDTGNVNAEDLEPPVRPRRQMYYFVYDDYPFRNSNRSWKYWRKHQWK